MVSVTEKCVKIPAFSCLKLTTRQQQRAQGIHDKALRDFFTFRRDFYSRGKTITSEEKAPLEEKLSAERKSAE